MIQFVKEVYNELLEQEIETAIRKTIRYVGGDPQQDGLKDTPERVVRSWEQLYSGYKQDPQKIMKWFDDDTDEMVVARDIDFYSTCEHHMLPFFGKAYVAYIPNGKVLGISKIARLVDCFSRRLQIQERITRQIGEAIESGDVIGVGVVLKGQHLCMMSRGVNKQGADIVTSYVSGAMREKPEAREEFMRFIE
ncbi:GTP cyclohydrolase I FolE [bacterium]|nr:GTP cyclohydrolase I FolE [bacterium]